MRSFIAAALVLAAFFATNIESTTWRSIKCQLCQRWAQCEGLNFLLNETLTGTPQVDRSVHFNCHLSVEESTVYCNGWRYHFHSTMQTSANVPQRAPVVVTQAPVTRPPATARPIVQTQSNMPKTERTVEDHANGRTITTVVRGPNHEHKTIERFYGTPDHWTSWTTWTAWSSWTGPGYYPVPTECETSEPTASPPVERVTQRTRTPVVVVHNPHATVYEPRPVGQVENTHTNHHATPIVEAPPARPTRAPVQRQPTIGRPTQAPPANPVVQLTRANFDRFVYCAGERDCGATVVKFYLKSCPACRSIAPIYREFARSVYGWRGVVRVAEIECETNAATCAPYLFGRSEMSAQVPTVRFFARNAARNQPAINLHGGPKNFFGAGVRGMRAQVANLVAQQASRESFADWPVFDLSPKSITIDQLWRSATAQQQTLVVLFDRDAYLDPTIAATILDLHTESDQMMVRRMAAYHQLTETLGVRDFPSVAVYTHGANVPVAVFRYHPGFIHDLEMYTGVSADDFSELNPTETSTPPAPAAINCQQDPKRCAQLYYASETDILKALRIGLTSFVELQAGANGQLWANSMSALRPFIDALIEDLPTSTVDRASGKSQPLPSSIAARKVFEGLVRFLDSVPAGQSVSIHDWMRTFRAEEERAGRPFPQEETEWQHCRSSDSQDIRGTTCGLWTAFHAMTVHAYTDRLNKLSFNTHGMLVAVRDYIRHFLGCEECRQHFEQMTIVDMPVEKTIKRPEDVFMYLWRAHNLVNARLAGEPGKEDPQFLKYQFPPTFLCADCSKSNTPDESRIQRFLVDYYSAIVPIGRSH